MMKEGAYDGVWDATGNLRAYIAKAVYGGRVNVNPKYKKQVINGKIADYDGVSLYPSAIYRLCRDMGLPIGKARRFAKVEIKTEEVRGEWTGYYRLSGWNFDMILKIDENGKYLFAKDDECSSKKQIECGTFGAKFYEDEDYFKRLPNYLEISKRTLDDCKLYETTLEKVETPLEEIGKFWQKYDYSIMTVKITKVNKHQAMPFIANKTKNSIEYLNTPPEEEIVVDSITLEDYIKFHNIEYKILDGVYWNNGYNKKMGDVVLRLFNARLKYKNTNTALANVIKLMLNSAYGKTIMKQTKTETKIIRTNYKTYNNKTKTWNTVEKTPFKDYVYNNFNTIKSWRQINDNCYEVERVCSDSSSNRGHIGCSILSMSKRIMNEVFDVANDNKLPIYYTDTDSIHMNCSDVNKLETEYKVKYNKELNGKNLEQFHTDFNLDNAVGEIYAKTSIFLGKKSYLDVLESIDKNGKTINGFHIRLKGITEDGLLDASKKYSDSYLGLYKDLSKGTKIAFTLNPFNVEENKQKVMFEFTDGAVRTRKEFIREVKF